MRLSFAVILCSLLCGISIASAATLRVNSSRSSLNVGDQVKVDISFDTQGENVNAIQGQITFPNNLFSFQGVNDGASPVTFWVEQPHEVASGVVEFSGIMPGGFTGQASSVLSILLTPVSGGTGIVSVDNAEVLRNDGQGSSVPVAVSSSWAFIVGSAAGSSVTASEQPVRFTIPESFTPSIARDPNIYNGQYFLVFSTTDKGSGINYYEVTEVPAGTALSQNPSWTSAKSPYLLKDQTLSSDIYVRAINNAGSSITVKLPAEHHSAGQIAWQIIVLVLGLILFGITAWVRHASRRGRRERGRRR